MSLRTLKMLLWRLFDTTQFRWLEGVWYRTVWRCAKADKRGVLLISIPGGGNIGDQAMFESFLRNTPGPVKAVIGKTGALSVPGDLESRVEVHVLEGLFQGRPQLMPKLVWKFGQLLRSSERLVVIGADIADGAYGLRQAWARTEALKLAVRLHIPARMIGFSWSARAHPEIEQAYRGLHLDVELLVRDPHSLDRLESAGISARLVPDTVFSLKYCEPREDSDAHVQIPVPSADERPLVLLNISGLLRKRFDLVQQYVSLAQKLDGLGMRILLLPHVFRPNDDDAAACTEVLEALDDIATVEMAETPHSPTEIQALAARASLVITGRMHLAIMALTVGTPAVVFESQGKVRGMLALFDLAAFAVEPGPNLASDTIERVVVAQEREEKLRLQIREHLPQVVENSSANFAP